LRHTPDVVQASGGVGRALAVLYKGGFMTKVVVMVVWCQMEDKR